ncbi:MAG: bifunctional DNA primase/polymerase [Pseudaminobacter sp.]|nr:bifunctional DNA primase/polymerase [Pseudaminobacter sp.]
MSGVFAEWQPRYAEHGVCTFPVTAHKVPAVKGYLRIGSDGSSQLAMKFPDNDAFGLAVKRNRITVLDVDAPDEKMLADAMAECGPSPFIVRSGSGNFQAWYRHNGERRKVRPNPQRPIDILGDGFVVAPPSISSKGRYEIIQGSLDDLDRLPRMKMAATGDLSNALDISRKRECQQMLTGTTGEDVTKWSQKRNDTLWQHCMKAARGCAKVEDLMEVAVNYNKHEFYEPLSDVEVLKVVASALAYESQGKNWFGHGARVVVEHDVIDDLAASEPHAYALLNICRRHHWGRDFALSKAFAESLGWTLRTFKDARSILVERKLIACIHPGGRGPNDPPMFRFPKGYENAPQ